VQLTVEVTGGDLGAELVEVPRVDEVEELPGA